MNILKSDLQSFHKQCLSMSKIFTSLFFVCQISLFLIITPLQAKEPPAISTGGANLNVMFLIDNSGSMRSRYATVQRAIRSLVTNKSLASMANFSMLTWGSSSCSWRGSSAYCPKSYSYRYVYTPVQRCYYTYQWRYYYGRWRYERVYKCYTYYTYRAIREYQDRYHFVPFSKDKVANYNAMMNGIQNINSNGGGTNPYYAFQFADQYTQSSTFKNQNTNSCDQTIVIFMSDGYFSSSSAYRQVTALRNRGIKTFVVAIDQSTSLSTYRAVANYGGTLNSPGVLGGTRVDSNSLARAFMQAIQSVSFDSYTNVAPTILPDTNAGDMILTPEFEYESKMQWKGRLKAKKINADGSIGSQIWDLGDNLNRTNPDSRRVWTAAAGIPTPTQNNRLRLPNNFDWRNSSYVTKFQNLMEPEPTFAWNDYYETYYLMRFIRGYDDINEDNNYATSYRWKLNDIYNSKPIYVSKPVNVTSDPNAIGGKKFFYDKNPSAFNAYQSKSRADMVYAGSNGGVVHAVDAKNGYEKWAFIPPPLLNKFKDILTSSRGSSNSIYGVDGSLVAEDVFVDGKWRTYLAIALGNGARGFSLLDITDPEYPAHILSIENYEDKYGNRVTKKWDSAGNLTNISGYEQLGFTTSAPIFSYTKDGRNYEPILIIGGGSSNGGTGSINNPIGNTVYYVSLKNSTAGNIIHYKDLNSPDGPGGATVTKKVGRYYCCNMNWVDLQGNGTTGLSVGSYVTGTYVPQNTVVTSFNSRRVFFNNPITRANYGDTLTFTNRMLNEVRTDIEILESGSTQFMKGKYGFRMVVPNNNGIIDSFDDTGLSSTKVTSNSTKERIINTLGAFKNDQVIQNPISISNFVADSKDEINLIYGTGDMENLSLMNKVPDNKIISIQNTEEDFFTDNKNRKANWLRYKGSMSYYNRLKDWLGFYNENYTFHDSTYRSAPSCKTDSQEGWYVSINGIRAYDKDGRSNYCKNGKLSTNIETFSGASIAGIYIPNTTTSTAKNSCSVGDSAITFRDSKCGTEITRGLYLQNTLIGGITAHKENVYITISGQQNAGNVDSQGKFKQNGNIITGKPGFSLSNSGSDVEVESQMRLY